MKKSLKYGFTVFATAFFVMFSLAQTVFALTWTTHTDMNAEGGAYLYSVYDVEEDSSGTLHVIAEKFADADFSIDGIYYGSNSGSGWTWTKISPVSTKVGNELMYADLVANSNGGYGAVIGTYETSTAGTGGSYYYADETTGWTNAMFITETASGHNLKDKYYGWDYTNNKAYVMLCNYNGSAYELQAYETTGATTFANTSAQNIGMGTGECGSLDLEMYSGTGGHMVFEVTDGGYTELGNATWDGSGWTIGQSLFEVPANKTVWGIAMELNGSNNPIFGSFFSRPGSSTGASDDIVYGALNGSWTTGTVANIDNIDNDFMQGSIDYAGGVTNMGMIHYVTGTGVVWDKYYYNGTSWQTERVASISATSGQIQASMPPAVNMGGSSNNEYYTQLAMISGSMTDLLLEAYAGPEIPEFETYVYLFAVISAFVVMHYAFRGPGLKKGLA